MSKVSREEFDALANTVSTMLTGTIVGGTGRMMPEPPRPSNRSYIEQLKKENKQLTTQLKYQTDIAEKWRAELVRDQAWLIRARHWGKKWQGFCTELEEEGYGST